MFFLDIAALCLLAISSAAFKVSVTYISEAHVIVLCYFCTLRRFLEYSTRSFTLKGFQNKEAFVGVSSRQDYSNFVSKYANALQWQNIVHVFHILCVVWTRISLNKRIIGILYKKISVFLLFEHPLSKGHFLTVSVPLRNHNWEPWQAFPRVRLFRADYAWKQKLVHIWWININSILL